MNIKIMENVLDKEDCLYMQNILLSSDFPWFFIKNSKDEHSIENGTYSFVHMLYTDQESRSAFFERFENILIKLLKKFNIKGKLLRARFGLHTSTKVKKIDDKHIDSLSDHDVILYYLNDSDGATYFYKNNKVIKQITPEFNKAVFFNGTTYHSSSKPIKSDRRIVLNLNVDKQ